jgi:hypothetical protein
MQDNSLSSFREGLLQSAEFIEESCEVGSQGSAEVYRAGRWRRSRVGRQFRPDNCPAA